ncbi:MAG TPA: hypothetical protein VLK36_03765 [Gaiellaceae bacterium]|nr:hypothetical protein [Gaiellaceae bacterium]
MRFLALSVVAALALASSAAAGPSPLVPPFTKLIVKKRAGALAYAPTRSPSGYRYLNYSWSSTKPTLTIRLHDKHYRPGNARHTATFTASWYGGSLASCSNGKQKTIQYDGNKVYWDGQAAWRCVSGPGGRTVKLVATGPTLPDVALAQIVSSGKHL